MFLSARRGSRLGEWLRTRNCRSSRNGRQKNLHKTAICHNEQSLSDNSGTVSKIAPRVNFSGIQPTGIPHLGNYFGALLNWVNLQRDAAPEDHLIFSIVGWHALTLPQDPKVLNAARIDMLAILLAIGIDPRRSILFHQDQNLNHVELAWILSCLASTGRLRRMTTWKARLAASRNANDEEEIDESLLNVGLLTYPILQAADILAYKTTHVPVGEDQQQHLELCRDLADTFNRTFSPKSAFFPIPQQVFTPSKRILSLKDPTSKMSKSSPDIQSRILLTDTPKQVRSKILGAVTDSTWGITFDPVNRPGVSNLLTILGACTNENPAEVATRYEGKGHGQFKSDVAEAVEEALKNPRAELGRIRNDSAYLLRVSEDGAAKARQHSEATMRQVRRLVGLD